MKIEYLQKIIDKKLFLEKYVDVLKYQSMCTSCPYYEKNYSCNTKAIDCDKFYASYKNIKIYLMKLTLDDSEKIENYEELYINPSKDRFIDMLYKYEKKVPRGIFINPGPCRLCEVCTREQGISCRHRDKLRYSASAMGIDATKISKDLFNIDLLWAQNKKIPDYFCFIAVMLYN